MRIILVLAPRKPCKKRCKTPVAPSDFYLVSGPLSPNGDLRVGSMDGDFPPYHNAIRQEQDAILNELVRNPVLNDADLEGSGVESAQIPLRPINTQWPINLRDWRGTVEPNQTVSLYLEVCAHEFSLNAIVGAATLGDRLVVEYGSYRLAARAVQEYMMRKKDYLLQSASMVTFNNPELTQRLVDIRAVGAIPLFRGPTPQELRCRGFPCDHSDAEYILSKIWKDAGSGRLIIASPRAIHESGKLIFCPTTAVRKRLPDRRRYEGRRAIWGGRLGNLFMSKSDYYPPALPTMKDIAEHIISLTRAYPHIPIKCTKRDINSAYRQIRLRPDACALFSTEFCGLHMGLDFDLVIGYRVLPFGWAGAPGVSASIAEIITRYHTMVVPSNMLWAGDQNFRSHLFVDDGILI